MTRRAVAAALSAAMAVSACADSELSSTPPASTATEPTVAAPPSTPSRTAPSAPAPASPPAPGSTGATPSSEDAAGSTSAPDPEPMSTEAPVCVEQLATRAKLALLVWPAVYSSAWDDAVTVVREHGVGGVVLMRPSGWTADELTQGIAELDDAGPAGVVVATDEEGGSVQRLSLLGRLPSQQEVSESRSPAEAQTLLADHAARVAAIGIDVVFAPVVDVVPGVGAVPLDRSRFFTGDAPTVAAYARAYLDAWQSAGVVPVIKHFPGHGTASADTHVDAGLTAPLSDLESSDLVPYRELAGRSPAVMVGHLTVPGLTGELPASRSDDAVRYLREVLDHGDALVVSDALGMEAVGVPVDRAAVDSIVAGIDVAIFTDTSLTGAVIDALVEAVESGELPVERVDASATRVLRLGGAERLGCDPG